MLQLGGGVGEIRCIVGCGCWLNRSVDPMMEIISVSSEKVVGSPLKGDLHEDSLWPVVGSGGMMWLQNPDWGGAAQIPIYNRQGFGEPDCRDECKRLELQV